jgi:hypothetical protein
VTPASRSRPADGLEVVASRPLGGAFVLDALWRRLGVADALRAVLGGRRFGTDVERVLFALVANHALAPPSKLAAAEWASRVLCELFARDPVVAEAWGLKEAFRAIYRARVRVEAERRLDRFLGAFDRAGLPAFTAFAKGVRAWRAELLAYFHEPTTNGYAEGVINKVKTIKRRA